MAPTRKSPALRGARPLLASLIAVSPCLAQAGPWEKVAMSASASQAWAVAQADLDGDGDLDALTGHPDSIRWFENADGEGVAWIEHTVDGAVDGVRSVAAADLDGDGDLDALAAVEGSGRFIWYENDLGSGSTWPAHRITLNAPGANSIAAADVDGDGDIDVAGAAREIGTIRCYLNRSGNGVVWDEHVVSTIEDGVNDLVFGDIDGDGDTDFVTSATSPRASPSTLTSAAQRGAWRTAIDFIRLQSALARRALPGHRGTVGRARLRPATSRDAWARRRRCGSTIVGRSSPRRVLRRRRRRGAGHVRGR